MNNDPCSHGLWEASAPAAPQTTPLTERISVDVVVVGGGGAGFSGLGDGPSLEYDIVERHGIGESVRNGTLHCAAWLPPCKRSRRIR